MRTGSTYWGPRFTSELWKPKAIYITENGAACKDKLTLKKEILDIDRIAFIRGYLASAQRAAGEGIPLKGYFAWSLFDNFEWAEGYTKRFGLIYVNYSNLERTPKLSAHFYKDLIAKNSLI